MRKALKMKFYQHRCILQPVHNHSAQEALSKASIILRKGGHVQTKIEPEPENEYDSNAIEFFCHIEGQWQKLGML